MWCNGSAYKPVTLVVRVRVSHIPLISSAMEIYLEFDSDNSYWNCIELSEKSFKIFLDFLEKTNHQKIYTIVSVEPVNNGKAYRPYYQTKVETFRFSIVESRNEIGGYYTIELISNNPKDLCRFCLRHIWRNLPNDMQFDPEHIFLTTDKAKAEEYSELMNFMLKEYTYNLIRKKSSKCIWTLNPEERHCKYCSKEYCLDRTLLPKKISKYEEGYLPVGKVEKLMLKK